ncbi:hypothetical protein JYT15_00030 [Acidimicrobium ferrooxidans]|nr:hypothetical protein [Acidimicrobium ferrooxidans]
MKQIMIEASVADVGYVQPESALTGVIHACDKDNVRRLCRDDDGLLAKLCQVIETTPAMSWARLAQQVPP